LRKLNLFLISSFLIADIHAECFGHISYFFHPANSLNYECMLHPTAKKQQQQKVTLIIIYFSKTFPSFMLLP